jgi:demethylmenaquinone methyltransferase/2-methoxy-6-polyprenyl-1,4-benzoquinol methylase
MAGDFESKPRDAAIHKLAPGKGEVVLEIGCGTGQAIVKMAEMVGHSGEIFGIDISDRMLGIAQSRVKRMESGDRVRLLCSDGVQIPFKNGVFDAILMSFTLELFDTPEIPMVLAECKRCLRTGGRICVVGLSKKQPNFMTGLYEWFHEKLPLFVDCRPIFVQQALESSGFQTLSANELSMMGLKSELVLAQSPL